MEPHRDGPRRRRWPRILLAGFGLAVVGALVLAHFLQPARLTALILDRASASLHLSVRTSGPGRFALRPEPRLVLPGLTATLPGDTTPFFACEKVELALPWDTLRGRGSDISRIVLKSPDVDVPRLKQWLATLPPSTAPFRFPRLVRGMQVRDATVRGAQWKFEHLDFTLPSLGDGLPMQAEAGGDLVRGANRSTFALTASATPSGAGRGMRIASADVTLKADGELPSLAFKGSALLADTIAIDLRGAFQRVPKGWTEWVDSSFAQAGETPFRFQLDKGPPLTGMGGGALEAMTARHGYRLKLGVGDGKREPALVVDFEGNTGAFLDAKLKGDLSRWPDAWPGLPSPLAAGQAPLSILASYQGPVLLTSPVMFDIRRGATSLKGQFGLEKIRGWLAAPAASPLPPVVATLQADRLDVGGAELHGVRLEVRDDPVPAANPMSRKP